ncbi:hypothetical protein PILCRDRAFT_14653 [Piloderma croceum F 1598]|uniref:Uncharacterized protein n=1 Tax=Piloderma croceum (strain F 1598) TaxID=765440 RepID=A0A0C3BA59_PILCF|nr:hypothetical protein PILCRDRAFT_14653 [Piloderma croceum F 1598]
MTKRKNKEKGKATKLGAPDHFTGFKKDFLVSQAGTYQQSLDTKTTTAFYNKVTADFVAKYGQEEPFHKEFVEDPPDPEDYDKDESEAIPLSESEAAEKAVLFAKLRTKLSQWYRRMYKRPEVTKGGAPSLANPYIGVMTANINKQPRRLSAFQWYFKNYYKSHVKEEYIRRFTIAKNEYDDASLEDKENGTVMKPIDVQIRTEVTKEFWNLETDEFRQQVAQDTEDAHAKAFEEWEQLKEVPKTAQQFHQQLASAGMYLHPVAEAIASQMQAAVSICIIGPIGERNGEVEVRSVHVNWPGGLAAATWPAHDPTGYAEAEKSMCAYGRANFSSAECKRRALPINVDKEMEPRVSVERTPSPIPSRPRTLAPPANVERTPSAVPSRPCTPASPVIVERTPSPIPSRPRTPAPPANVEHTPSAVPSRPRTPASLVIVERAPSPIPSRHRTPASLAAETISVSTATDNGIVRNPPPSPPRLNFSPIPPSLDEPDEELPIPQAWRRVKTPEHKAEPQQATIEGPNNDSTPDVTTHDSLTTEAPPRLIRLAFTHVVNNNVANARDWGSTWSGCVREFIEFQRRFNFPDTGPAFPPATETRPPEIAAWMKNRRPWKDVDIVDTELFGRQWWAWWLSLQPDSRKRHDEPTADMDWAKVQKPGKNGFLLIMLALVWWGAASNREGEWLKAVADITDVLRCICKVVQQPTKRSPLSGSGVANTARPVSSKRSRKGEAVGEGPSKKRLRVGR